LETTPILFRLPTVDLHPFRPLEEEASNHLQAIPAFQQEIQTATSLRALEAAARASTPPLPLPEAAESADGTSRTWWEHWSSGVVMILLIVAVVTLGIMIFQPSDKPTDSSLASQYSNEDFGDLDSIAIPTIQSTESSTPEGNPFPSSIAAMPGWVASDQQPATNSATSGQSDGTVSEFDASLATDLANIEVAPFDNQPTSDSDEMPLESLANSQPSSPESNQLGNAQGQLATARLSPPTPDSNPQQAYAGIPPFPVDVGNNPSQPFPALDGTVTAQPAATGQLGQSPSLYDEATRQNIPAGQSAPNSLATSAFSMPNIAGNRIGSAPTATQVSGPAQGIAGTKPNPTVRTTTTPESNEEEIIRAYLELTESTQQTPSTDTGTDSANRYRRN